MSNTSLATLIRIRAIQNKMRSLVAQLNDHDYRAQFHPDLSPLGWHLGHCVYIENYWLREYLGDDDTLTRGLDRLYVPELSPKPERGGKLPELSEMIATAKQQQDNNTLLLLEMTPPYSSHDMFDDEYLQYFIIQHYAQHYETMQMILQQRAMLQTPVNYTPDKPLVPGSAMVALQHIDSGRYDIGGIPPLAYDNELQQHAIHLDNYSIAERPVNNAEYLGFIESGGYRDPQYWDPIGWDWLQNTETDYPEHWRMNDNDEWYGIDTQGAYDLQPDEPAYGINFYEATAYTRWAGARLPREEEWEVALRLHKLQQTGQVWEWCNNTFYPYDGFEAFPYDGYSKPWFDEQHYVLRGASKHTRPEIRRPSFRNFFNADKRHQFAGLRLAYD